MKKIGILLAVLLSLIAMTVVCSATAPIQITVNDPYTGQILSASGSVFYLPGYIDLHSVSFNVSATQVITGGVTVDHADGDNVDITGGKVTKGESVYYEVTFVTSKGNVKVTVYPLSSIPSVYIDSSLSFSSSGWQDKDERDPDAKIVIANEDGSIAYDDVTGNTSSEVKGRGNMSWTYAKKPCQIKLSSKTDLFGMGKAKTWILLANYIDSSFLRNSATFKVAQALNMDTCIEDNYVNVYINGEYRGLYEMTEKVQIGKNRVNIDDLEEATEKVNEGVDLDSLSVKTVRYGDFIDETGLDYYSYVDGVTNPDDITGGYLLEIDNLWSSGDKCKFKTENGNTYVIKSPENASEEQVQYIARFVSEMEEAIYSSDGYNSLGKHYSEYCDVDSMLEIYVVNEITKNWDAYVGSTFFYKDADKDGTVSKMYAGPVWDYDNAYGNLYRTVTTPEGVKADFGNDTDSLWANGANGNNYTCFFGKAITSHKELWNRLCELMQEAADASDEMAAEGGYLDQMGDKLNFSAVADRNIWGYQRNAAFKQYSVYNGDSENSAIGALRSFILKRDAAMREYFSSSGEDPESTTETTAVTTAVTEVSATSAEETTVSTTEPTETTTVTEAAETTAAGENGKTKGCFSSVSLTAVLPAACAMAVIAFIRKKEDAND